MQGHQLWTRITGEVDCDTRAVRNIRAYDEGDPRTNIADSFEQAKMEAMLLRKAAWRTRCTLQAR